MRIRTRALIATLLGVSLLAVGCASQQPPELSATDTAIPTTQVVADSSAVADPQQQTNTETTSHPNTPTAVATRVVARNQEILYATSDEIQDLIALDTTNNGRNTLNDLVAERIAPLRARLAELPAATTWYIVRPLTATIEEQTATTATVTVWSTTIFSRQDLLDPEAWYWLTDITLINTNGQWLVDTYNQRPGPAAAPGQDHWPTTATDLDTQLEGHQLLDPDKNDTP